MLQKSQLFSDFLFFNLKILNLKLFCNFVYYNKIKEDEAHQSNVIFFCKCKNLF